MINCHFRPALVDDQIADQLVHCFIFAFKLNIPYPDLCWTSADWYLPRRLLDENSQMLLFRRIPDEPQFASDLMGWWIFYTETSDLEMYRFAPIRIIMVRVPGFISNKISVPPFWWISNIWRSHDNVYLSHFGVYSISLVLVLFRSLLLYLKTGGFLLGIQEGSPDLSSRSY